MNHPNMIHNMFEVLSDLNKDSPTKVFLVKEISKHKDKV